ncbi:MAG: DUF616 domain-containing protein [Lachnospiraceae bacterium]|nr:DUF616 domain-containing protein [Lachnospiraceae bacterium]
MRKWQVIEENIKLAQSEQFKVCIWGAGLLGKTVGYDALKKLNIVPDYYCDNNEKLWQKEIVEGIFCVDYHQLLSEKEKIIWFVFMGVVNEGIVIKQLLKLGIKNFVTLPELLEAPNMAHKYFDFMGRKKVAYTCIVGDYDNVFEPGKEVRELFDFYLISDKAPQQSSVYHWINIKDVIPSTISDFTRMNRYCKINAHKIFPEYRNSVYYDGNVILEHNLDNCFEKLKKTRIGVASPNRWECMYAEAVRLMPQMRDDPEIIYSQMKKYWREGMPEKFGSCWCNVLIREHNNPICVKLMEEWWHEVETQSKRDQLSFPYVLWKNNYSMEDVLMISDSVEHYTHWSFIDGHNVSRLINVKDI